MTSPVDPFLGLAAAVLVALVALVRRERGWLAAKLPWLATDRGGASLALLLGALAEVAARLNGTAGDAPAGTVAALVTALAAGGRAILIGMLAPKDKGTPGG